MVPTLSHKQPSLGSIPGSDLSILLTLTLTLTLTGLQDMERTRPLLDALLRSNHEDILDAKVADPKRSPYS